MPLKNSFALFFNSSASTALGSFTCNFCFTLSFPLTATVFSFSVVADIVYKMHVVSTTWTRWAWHD